MESTRDSIIKYLLLDDNTVLVGLEDIAGVLQCSTKYVRKLKEEYGLPIACIDNKYYSVRSLIIEWLIKRAKNGATRIDADKIVKNLTEESKST